MKKLISLILIVSNFAQAECNFSTGITPAPDGYLYTKECHIRVGEMKQDLDIANQQIGYLNKAIDLKDLALSKSDDRTKLWMDTSFKLEDRVNTIESLQSKNYILYFGLGVATTIGAAWAASKLLHP